MLVHDVGVVVGGGKGSFSYEKKVMVYNNTRGRGRDKNAAARIYIRTPLRGSL